MIAKRIVVVALLAALLIGLSGCSFPEYFRSQKANMNSYNKTEYTSDDYKVLGPVEAKTKSMSILAGLYAEGNEGQALLWDDAHAKYGDKVTGIKDVTAVVKFMQVLGFVYQQAETTYMGVAVQEQ